jgi:8-oxo-dGTP diphosphatase
MPLPKNAVQCLQSSRITIVMPYAPITGTLGFVLSRDKASVLMVHRTARPDDHAYGKYNGLGGKLERDEDVAQGMMREIREEAGIDVAAMTLRGTVSWPGFGKNGEDWLGFVFLITAWTGTPHTRNEEGELSWVPIDTLLCWSDLATRAASGIDMWPGDGYFLPLVFGADTRMFHGVMPYRDGVPVSWQCSWT